MHKNDFEHIARWLAGVVGIAGFSLLVVVGMARLMQWEDDNELKDRLTKAPCACECWIPGESR